MTTLLHTRGPLERLPDPSGRRGTAGENSAQAYLAAIGRFCISAIAVVAAGAALVAIMALKVIVYLPHVHHY
jgi:hypothetical protein